MSGVPDVVLSDVTIPGDLVGLVIVVFSLAAGAMLGLFGWGLKQTVDLARVVAELKVHHEDHERRITALEG